MISPVAQRSERAPARARVYLASRSPRRAMLLKEHGIEHETLGPVVDDAELIPGPTDPANWVAALAYLKARAGLDATRRADPNVPAVVIGADTVCVADGKILGQPGDADEARRILETLEDAEHEVMTGVALVGVDARGRRVRDLYVDRARVRLGRLGPARIDEYVRSGQWAGKAGGYNLRERLDAGWPISFEGDPSTIMGLPIRGLAARLAALARELGAAA